MTELLYASLFLAILASGNALCGQTVPPISTTLPLQKTMKLQFPGIPSLPKRIRKISIAEAPDDYVVEKGDTLYGICSKLLGEPQYWPKLWALNPDIKNPHFIWPGMHLRFHSGDLDTPPYLKLAEHSGVAGIPMIDIDKLDTAAWSPQKVLDDTIGTMITAEQLPPFVDGLFVAAKSAQFKQKNITLPGIIQSKRLATLGTISSSPLSPILASSGQEVLISTSADLAVGSSYTVVRDIGSFQGIKGEPLHIFIYVGQLEVVENASAATVAIVGHIEHPVEVEDLVIGNWPRKRAFSPARLDPMYLPQSARIVKFGIHYKSIGAEGSFVFVNAGTAHGVVQGQVLEVASGNFLATTRKLLRSDAIGTVQIIEASRYGSLGYILESKHEITVGDLVGVR